VVRLIVLTTHLTGSAGGTGGPCYDAPEVQVFTMVKRCALDRCGTALLRRDWWGHALKVKSVCCSGVADEAGVMHKVL
jgi:hypothetical protein